MKVTQSNATVSGIIHDIIAFICGISFRLFLRRWLDPRMSLLMSVLVAFVAGPFLPSEGWAQLAPTVEQQTDQVVPDDDVPQDEEDEASDGTSSTLSRRGRNQPQDGPVGSQQWANAGFTGFIDVRERPKQPDQELLDQGLRLLTTDDFPPFNFRGADDQPEGFHIELARVLCEELSMACTLKIVPFDEIPILIADGRADAAVAGIANSQAVHDKLAFSHVYLKRPARFVRKLGTLLKLDKMGLKDVAVAVRGGTAHEAYLRTYFPQVNRVPVTDMLVARQLLIEGQVQSVFGDGFQLLPMVASDEGQIEFAGKPYYDARFFGEGMSIAYGRDQTDMRTLLNYGLLRLAQKGRLAELYASHFAVDIYAAKD